MNSLDFVFGKDNRSYWMGLSILWIILLHVSSNIGNRWLTIIFGNGYLGVDVFFMLSTYGLCYSFEKNSLRNFYANRIKRFFPEYIVYLAILFSVFGNDFMVGDLIKLGLYQCMGVATFRNINIEWYVPTLVVLYLIFPLLYKSVSSLWEKSRFLSILLIPVIALFVYHYGWTSMLWLAAPRMLIVYTTLLLYLSKDDTKTCIVICLTPALCSFILRADLLNFSPALYLPLLIYAISYLSPILPF